MQQVGGERTVVGQHVECSLDGILKLANIAGPIVCFQFLKEIIGYRYIFSAEFEGEF